MSQADMPQSDPMMEELREIRDHISDVIADMSVEERVQWYHQQAIEAATSIGRVLVPHPTFPNAMVMKAPETSLPKAP